MNYSFRIVDLTLLKDEDLWGKLLKLNEGDAWEAIHCFRFIKDYPNNFCCARLVVAYLGMEPVAWCGCFYYDESSPDFDNLKLAEYAELHSCNQNIQCYTHPMFRRRGLQRAMLPILAGIAEQFDELQEFGYDDGWAMSRQESCQNTFKYFTKNPLTAAKKVLV